MRQCANVGNVVMLLSLTFTNADLPIQGQICPFHRSLDYKHDVNYFSFSFYCINFIKPRNIVYRYQMVGYFDDWINH